MEGKDLPWKHTPHIHWGPEERRVVLIELLRIAEAHPNETEAWLITEAQKVLQPHRRRSERSMKLGRKTLKIFRAMCQLFDQETGEPLQ